MITSNDINKQCFLRLKDKDGVKKWLNVGARVVSAPYNGYVDVVVSGGPISRVIGVKAEDVRVLEPRPA